ncbi:MAG: ArsR family transcriptional regulator [Acidimicrobiales bacterium]|jgi:DNA-binding transcriptional ArsR family regulator
MAERDVPTPSERAVLRALAAGAERAGELTAATELSPRTVSASLKRLAGLGLVEGSERARRITAAGRRHVLPDASTGDDELGRMTRELLPAPLAAMARLIVDAVVFRHHWPTRNRQPGFLVFGPTGTGKTTLAQLVASFLGLDFADVSRDLPALSAGEVLGRRSQVAGGEWRFAPAEHLSRPFVFLDEADKADPDVRKRTFSLFQDSPRIRVEDETIVVRAVALVAFNAEPSGSFGLPREFHPAHYRRSVACSTAALTQAEIAAIPRAVRAYLGPDEAPSPLVSIADCPPLGQLPDDDYGRLLELGASDVLTSEGRNLIQPSGLECLVLGRAGRLGGTDALRSSTAGVLLDVLAAWETVPGVVQPDWQMDVEAWRRWLGDTPGADSYVAAVERLDEHRAELTAARAQRRVTRSADELELGGRREELRTRLDDAERAIRQGIPAQERPYAAAVRHQLRALRDQAGDARSMAGLVEVAELAAPKLADAARLRAGLDVAKAVESERIADAKQQQAESRRDAASAAVHGKAQARATEKALREARATVKRQRSEISRAIKRVRTSAGADVLAELARLRVIAPLSERFEVAVPPPIGAAIKARLSGKPAPAPGKRLAERVRYIDHSGRRFEAAQLGAWGLTGTRQALSAALDALEAIEQAIHRGQLLSGELASPRPPSAGSAIRWPRSSAERGLTGDWSNLR